MIRFKQHPLGLLIKEAAGHRQRCQRKIIKIREIASVTFFDLNPLPPKPAITGRDESWPFLHFWRRHFWPKLVSSIVNFCRRKRSFQWCPGQSDQPYGAWDMHKNAPKLSEKLGAKFPAAIHGSNLPISMTPSWKFLSSRRPITAAKWKEKEKNEKRKKNQKSRSLKT